MEFLSWKDCFANPVKCSDTGMLIFPDLAKFGRSEQLHAALWGIHKFLSTHGKYPAAGDIEECKGMANDYMKAAGEEGMTVEIEDETFQKAVSWTGCSISPMCAFFGGIVAQEIVKQTGKYSPLK